MGGFSGKVKMEKKVILIVLAIVAIIYGSYIILLSVGPYIFDNNLPNFNLYPAPICSNGHIKTYIVPTGRELVREDFIVIEVDEKDVSKYVSSENLKRMESSLLFDYDCEGYCSGIHSIKVATVRDIYTVSVECS